MIAKDLIRCVLVSLAPRATLIQVLMLLTIAAAAQTPESARKPSTAQSAAPSAVVSGLLSRSDRPFSPRTRDSATKWQEPFDAFLSNRILWTYAGPAIIPEASSKSVPVQCSVEFWVPESQPDKEQMICTNPRGGYGGFKSDSAQTAGGLRRPDVNSPAWRAYQLKSVQRLISAGCTSFQQDVPLLNVQMLKAGGCHSDGSISGFREYLRRKLSAAELASLGVVAIDTFDYRNSSSAALKNLYEEFQKESTGQYHGWLHKEAQNLAKRKVVFSGNVPPEQLRGDAALWLKPHFDFLLSELRATPAEMPERLREMVRLSEPFGRTSAVTFVSGDVMLNQRAIASAYALGLVPVAPWDVYIAPGAPRFFGNAADFAPLFRMVRDNAALFDDFESRGDWYGEYGPVTPDAPSGYLITIRENARKTGHKVVHIVNWNKGTATRVRLKREAFPVAPTMVITPANPKPTRVLASVAGDDYVYSLGDVAWAMLVAEP
jgi:hypothetical protein